MTIPRNKPSGHQFKENRRNFATRAPRFPHAPSFAVRPQTPAMSPALLAQLGAFQARELILGSPITVSDATRAACLAMLMMNLVPPAHAKTPNKNITRQDAPHISETMTVSPGLSEFIGKAEVELAKVVALLSGSSLTQESFHCHGGHGNGHETGSRTNHDTNRRQVIVDMEKVRTMLGNIPPEWFNEMEMLVFFEGWGLFWSQYQRILRKDDPLLLQQYENRNSTPSKQYVPDGGIYEEVTVGSTAKTGLIQQIEKEMKECSKGSPEYQELQGLYNRAVLFRLMAESIYAVITGHKAHGEFNAAELGVIEKGILQALGKMRFLESQIKELLEQGQELQLAHAAVIGEWERQFEIAQKILQKDFDEIAGALNGVEEGDHEVEEDI